MRHCSWRACCTLSRPEVIAVKDGLHMQPASTRISVISVRRPRRRWRGSRPAYALLASSPTARCCPSSLFPLPLCWDTGRSRVRLATLSASIAVAEKAGAALDSTPHQRGCHPARRSNPSAPRRRALAVFIPWRKIGRESSTLSCPLSVLQIFRSVVDDPVPRCARPRRRHHRRRSPKPTSSSSSIAPTARAPSSATESANNNPLKRTGDVGQ